MSLRHLPTPEHRKRARRLLLTAYTCFAAGGLLVLIIPPRTIEHALGPWLHWVWALMVLIGAAVGALAVLRSNWRPERWTSPLLVGGLIIYAGTLAYLAAASDSWGRSGLAFLTLGTALMLAYRGVEVDARAKADRDDHEALGG